MVEDEKSILVTTGMYLRSLGYTVLTAEDPERALRLAAQHPGEIHLLITDVVMPGVNGSVLAKRLTELRPSTGCLYMSGFDPDISKERGISVRSPQFLAKPFSRDQIASRIREILAAERTG